MYPPIEDFTNLPAGGRVIKLQNHIMLTKKKEVWTPEAQTGTWKNNRQKTTTTTTTPTQCYVLLQKWSLLGGATFLPMGLKHCASYNRYYC